MPRKRLILFFTAFFVIFFMLFLYAFASEPSFPQELTNEYKTTPRKLDIPKNSEIVKYQVNGKTCEALVVYPENSGSKRSPALLFIQTGDEKPADQIKKMQYLAKNGYVVMCTSWKDQGNNQEAYKQLLKYRLVDPNAVGIIGAHDGATQAIFVGCKELRTVKAVVSIAGMPPYDLIKEPAEIIWAPVLLIHGDQDSQTPLSVSQYFYFNLLDKGRLANISIMQSYQHYFNDAEWDQIMGEAVRFCDQYVKGISPEGLKSIPEAGPPGLKSSSSGPAKTKGKNKKVEPQPIVNYPTPAPVQTKTKK